MKWFGDMGNKQLPTILLTDYLNRGKKKKFKPHQSRIWKMWHRCFPVEIPPYVQALARRWGQRQGPAVWVRWVSGSSPSVPHEQGLRTGGSGQRARAAGSFAASVRSLRVPVLVWSLRHTEGISQVVWKWPFHLSGLCIPQNGSGSVAPGCRGDAKSPSPQKRLSCC